MSISILTVRFVCFSLLLLSIAGLLSCASPIDTEEYRPFELFDPKTSMKVFSTPDYIYHDGTNTLGIEMLPRLSGKGAVLVVGHGGGAPAAMVLEPISGLLGEMVIPVTFNGGDSMRIELVMSVFPGVYHLGIGVEAIYDSLLIDGTYYSINSLESVGVIGGGAVTSVYGHIVLNDREK